MADLQQTISVPSIILVAAIGAVVVRYFFYSPSDSTNSQAGGSRAANPNDVEQIATMFPQVARRDIMWDLQRNGGNVASTTERILGAGRLDMPPPTFQPVTPDPSTAPPASMSKSDYVDLIKRYNLSEKVKASPSSAAPSSSSSPSSQPTWSTDKDERQAILRRRREEMILNARRKMEEKQKGGTS